MANSGYVEAMGRLLAAQDTVKEALAEFEQARAEVAKFDPAAADAAEVQSKAILPPSHPWAKFCAVQAERTLGPNFQLGAK